MKVVAFNGSARKDGNTAILINHVRRALEDAGIATELVQLAGTKLQGCIACFKCYERKDRRCAVTEDAVNDYIEMMLAAQGLILGSPTYFADVSASLKALMERTGMVARANDDMFQRKVGAAVVAVRRAGAIHAFDSINHFFSIGQMIVPGSIYWNIGIGREKGEVEKDDEGVRTMQVLGKNMAWLIDKLYKP